MRDGVILETNVFPPQQPGRYPVLVDRTPYGKSGGTKSEGIYFAQHGYAVVIEDTRSRYDSDGVWYAFMSQTTITPNPDTVQEVRVLQNNYSVQYNLWGTA